MADEVIERCRHRLPPEIRPHANGLPVTFEPFPQGAMLDDENVEPDILGLFVGADLATSVDAAETLPPQILLFLENLWDHAEGNLAAYREEVRISYLHDLGHYLGWDEEEIAERGLE